MSSRLYEKAHPKKPFTSTGTFAKSYNSTATSKRLLPQPKDGEVKTNQQLNKVYNKPASPTTREFLSHEERRDKMAKGLCFFCDEKFTPEHDWQHKKTQLYTKEVDAETKEVDQLLRQFQELFEKLSLASIMFEQTFSSITEPKNILPSFFRLKHKWRSRLSHSFSKMKQRMIVSVWKSFGYLMEAHGSKYKGLGCVVEKKKLRNVEDGVKQDKNRFSGDVRAKIFMALEELHLLQDVFEMVKELLLKTSLVIQSLVIQQVMRSKKFKFLKRWMFKYKAPHLDTKVFETSDQCTKKRVFVGADRLTKNNQPTLRSLMNAKQSCPSHRANRVWDPGGSLVVAATP